MRIKWLHISDIHFSYAGFDTSLARNDLVDCLRKISETELFTDLFVTGDVLYQYNQSSQDTIAFLNEIVAAIGISKDHVWIIPGNHDHYRHACNEIYSSIYETDDPNLAVDKLTDDKIDSLLESFKYYKEFCDLFYGNASVYEERKLHWHAPTQDKCSIIGLNTAWLEKDSSDDPYIRIGLKQLMEALKHIQHDNDAVNIAIGHHPIDKLFKRDQEHILELFHRNNIQLYLCGHEHGAGAKYYEDADVLQIDAAGLLVDGFSYGGYCIGTIDTSTGTQKVEFFRWNLSDEHWNPERSRIGVSIDGICYFEHIKQKKKISNIVIDAKLLDGPIPDQDIFDAIKDKEADIIRFSTSNIAGKIEEKHWKSLRSQLRMIKKAADEKRGDKRLCIFPIAPIPLLVEMGFMYQRNTAVLIWQYDRRRNKWMQNDRYDADYKLRIQESLVKKSGKLIVSVSTSVTIFNDQINALISTVDNDLIQFYTNERQVGYPLDARIVKQFAQEICIKIMSVVGQYIEVHLFLAVPAGLAIEIGRWIQKNIFPRICLYHYQAGYHYAYTINDT